MFVNELFENKDLGQEAKELIAMVDNPNAISKAMNAIKQILARVRAKQQPQQEPQQEDNPVNEDVAQDRAFAIAAIDEIANSGDIAQLNSVISFLKSEEILESATEAINANLAQGVKGGLDQKLAQLVQNHNAPFEQKKAFFDQMVKGFWYGSDLLKDLTGNIYQKMQGDPVLQALAKPMAIQLRGAMGYGPDQGPGEFLLALTGQGVDLAEKSDLVIVDGVGVEVKADNGGIISQSGKKSRAGGRLYSTSGYGTASTARLEMFKAMVDNGVPAEVMKQFGWPARDKGQKIPAGGLNLNIKGVDNLNQLFSQYLDKAGVQEVMKAMVRGLYIDLPDGMDNNLVNAVNADGTIDYKTIMDELIVLGHEYYKHQEGHTYIMIFNTSNGDYVMMGDEKQTRELLKKGLIRPNSGMDFFDDRSKGTPQLLTNIS